MTPEKRKQISSTVVLASHGNKNACKELYINYYKEIFFICSCMSNNVNIALKNTQAAFKKMFSLLEKLGDYNAFEPWFYSITINLCRDTGEEQETELTDAGMLMMAKTASVYAKNSDSAGFEKAIIQLIEKAIICLPKEARVFYFYKNFAGLTVQEIALLEKITAEETQKRIDAVNLLCEKQNEKLKECGVDLTAFTADITRTLEHIASKKYVPASVHNAVSTDLGINVSPFKEEKPIQKTEKIKPETAKKSKKKEEKSKFAFTKGDLFLFFGIIAAVLIISTVAGQFFGKDDTSGDSSVTNQYGEKPAILWNGSADTVFDGGSGTKEDPYQIATGNQLAYLANLVNEGNSLYAASHYVLTADIVLNETSDFNMWHIKPPANKWTPIGGGTADNSYKTFKGVFDGGDHTISGMYINLPYDNIGLFGYCNNAQIKNVTLKNCYVAGSTNTGGIAGYFEADAKSNTGFTYCGFSGIVKSNENNAGGIAGYFRAEGDNNITEIMYCYSTGSVFAQNGYAGGIAGVNEAASGGALIKNCFSSSSVSSNKNAGGITGDSRAASSIATIENSYASGKITANSNAGGISGYANCVSENGKVLLRNCIMLDSSCDTAVTKGMGEETLIVESISVFSEDEMKNNDNFVNFNFTEVWTNDNSGKYAYPILRGTVFEFISIDPIEPESEEIAT